MTKRPLHPRFNQAVLDGRKITTIRDRPWPIGKPIMLYNWSAAAYRSPQINVAPVIVEEVMEFPFHKRPGCPVGFAIKKIAGKPIYQTEGFATHEDFLAWFTPIIPEGVTVVKYLMKFHRLKTQD